MDKNNRDELWIDFFQLNQDCYDIHEEDEDYTMRFTIEKGHMEYLFLTQVRKCLRELGYKITHIEIGEGDTHEEYDYYIDTDIPVETFKHKRQLFRDWLREMGL